MNDRKTHKTDSEKYSDEQIAANCERIYRRYKANPDSEEFFSMDDVMRMLGIKEDDIKNIVTD